MEAIDYSRNADIYPTTVGGLHIQVSNNVKYSRSVHLLLSYIVIVYDAECK